MLTNKKIHCPFCNAPLKATKIVTKESEYIVRGTYAENIRGVSKEITEIVCSNNEEHKLPQRLRHIANRIVAHTNAMRPYF